MTIAIAKEPPPPDCLPFLRGRLLHTGRRRRRRRRRGARATRLRLAARLLRGRRLLGGGGRRRRRIRRRCGGRQTHIDRIVRSLEDRIDAPEDAVHEAIVLVDQDVGHYDDGGGSGVLLAACRCWGSGSRDRGGRVVFGWTGRKGA